MKKTNPSLFGLIGTSLGHSFSSEYFNQKFKSLGINAVYQNFELGDISEFQPLLSNLTELKGLNVTHPFKQSVIPYLHSISEQAARVNAVNTIVVINQKGYGYNSDIFGFTTSLCRHLSHQPKKTLILGSGGASKAIQFALRKLHVQYDVISRSTTQNYQWLDQQDLKEYDVIINTTPLGSFPNIEEKPMLNYAQISDHHLCFDLVYNPEKTAFLKASESQGARTLNGLEMLHLQAEKSWTYFQQNL